MASASLSSKLNVMDWQQVANKQKQVRIHAPAKLNLFLELLSRDQDGFHRLETVMTTVSLYDTIRFQPRNDGRLLLRSLPTIGGDRESIPMDESNLVWRAADRLRRQARDAGHQVPGATITLIKRIPSQAGLGGGSSDAAATLLAANQVWGLNLSKRDLAEHAIRLGSDVPFFLDGGMAYCTGRGENVSRIPSRCRLNIVIAKPRVGLATKTVYQHCEVPRRPLSGHRILEAIARGEQQEVGAGLANRLQPAAAELTPWVERLSDGFSRLPCLGHQMSGSGSSYFGIFRTRRAAEIGARVLKSRFSSIDVFRCHSTVPLPRNRKERERV